MKKYLSSIVSLLLIFSLLIMPVFAVSTVKDSKFDIVKMKKDLVNKYKDKKVDMTEEVKKARREKINNELLELTANGIDIREIDQKMKEYGLIRLEVPQDSSNIYYSTASDITLNTPSIYYDYQANEWTVSGGGNWITNAWKYDSTAANQILCPASQNLGGVDSIGISLHDPSGTYNASMVDCQGYYSDGAGNYTLIQYADNNNYAQGITFSYQDIITDSTPMDSNWDDWKYKGKNFSALATYSSAFVNYGGNANTFYAHTWNSTTINSVTLGTSGASVTFSSSNNRFTAYSPDTSF